MDLGSRLHQATRGTLSDFTTLTRQVTLAESTDPDSVIYGAAQRLLKDNWHLPKPVRLIGVGASNLAEPAAQLRLWDTSNEKGQRLQQTLDSLRDRFGRNAIQRAFVMKPPSDAWRPSDMCVSESGESPEAGTRTGDTGAGEDGT